MNDDELSRYFDELPSPMVAKPGRAAAIVASTRRRRAYAASASVAAVVLVVGSFALLGAGHVVRGGPAAPTPAPAVTTTPPKPVPSAAAAPSTVSVSCWDSARPIALSRIKPGMYGTAIAAPLRSLLARPGAYAALGLGRLPRAQWALLDHDATHRLFAQRTATGISAVLYFKLYLGSWRPDVQCDIRYGSDTAVAVRQAAVSGRTLDLNWDNGTCDSVAGRPISSLVRRVVVTETTTHVLVSLVTYENPVEVAVEASQAAALPSGTVLGCAGVGLDDHVEVTLKAPLGNRTLLDVSTVPPRLIDLTGTVGKPLS